MEYENTLTEEATFHQSAVLILVLMEYENTCDYKITIQYLLRLNPCFNGIRKYVSKPRVFNEITLVLILVLMEYENTDAYLEYKTNDNKS